MPWIPVAARLPGDDEAADRRYLVTDGRDFAVATWLPAAMAGRRASRFWAPGAGFAAAEITHWAAIEPPLPVAAAGSVACPACGNAGLAELEWCEDVVHGRDLVALRGGRLILADADDRGAYDDGTNPRLSCKACGAEFALPADVAVDVA